MDWFLYDNGLRYERVKQFNYVTFTKYPAMRFGNFNGNYFIRIK